MAEFITNIAGAKIYKDVSKHKKLAMPKLNSPAEEGVVYEVLSVGMNGRTPIATVKEGSKAIAYTLPTDLFGWVQNFMMMSQDGVKLLPAKIEFGILEGRAYAEIY